MKDFRGKTIEAFERGGWVYHGEVCIDKDPQALRNGTRVLTPRGWCAVEEVLVGDELIGANGRPTKVTHVTPHGKRPTYKVTFTDGACVECDGNHLWTVGTEGLRNMESRWRTLTTEAILSEGLRSPSGRLRWDVPIVAPVQFSDGREQPLDPYMLGAIIGDGNVTQRSSVSLCTQHEVVQRFRLPKGHATRRQDGTDKGNGTVAVYHIVGSEWHENDVLSALRKMGLQGKRAWEKFIPDDYLYGPEDVRREMLRGLLDTDGSVSKRGKVKFTTTSARLAEDVRFLIQSIGGLALTSVNQAPKYTYKGMERLGRPQWEIVVQIDGDWCPVTLPTKVSRWEARERRPIRKIASIESTGRIADCTCLGVESKDGLFVVEQCVVTHNSQAIRTHSKGLLFTQLRKDSSWIRPAMADYILVFRKPGEPDEPIHPDITNNEWIEWARPIWYGIRESDTLNVAEARSAEDDRHICPLALGTIERVVRLWSNTGDTVLSPFAGIGSEGYVSLQFGRKFVGCELKPLYCRTAARNLDAACKMANAPDLFSQVSEDVSR